jgi:methionyl aminopeptidase
MHKTATGKSQNGILHSIIPPKVVSKPDPATGFFNPFPSYSYTGPLRPVYPLSPKRTVPKSIPHPDYAETGIPKSSRLINRNKIEVLDAKAQEGMRKVCRLAREVLDIVAAEAKPGVTTDYLDEICHKACIERNVGLGTHYRKHVLTFLVLPLPAEL